MAKNYYRKELTQKVLLYLYSTAYGLATGYNSDLVLTFFNFPHYTSTLYVATSSNRIVSWCVRYINGQTSTPVTLRSSNLMMHPNCDLIFLETFPHKRNPSLEVAITLFSIGEVYHENMAHSLIVLPLDCHTIPNYLLCYPFHRIDRAFLSHCNANRRTALPRCSRNGTHKWCANTERLQ